MKKLTALLAAGLVLGASGMAMALGNTASDASAVGATIVLPITIANTASLEFGKVVPYGTVGTVTVANNGDRSSSDTKMIMATQTGTVSAASFDVDGEVDATYTITLPPGDVTLNGPSASTMTVNTFTSSVATTAGAGVLTLGAETFTVGAVLNVGATQTAGAYTGTFNVAVAYN